MSRPTVVGYLPDERLVRDRVDGGAARARKTYSFPPEHVTADGVEVYVKLVERARWTDGLCCYLCGRSIRGDHDWHLDHVIPLVLRGPHAVDNLEVACVGCNLTKGDVRLQDFLGADYYPFMAAGGLPPFVEMRTRPVSELWERSPSIARRFARRPREVPYQSWGPKWYDPVAETYGLDAQIATVLSKQGDSWQLAMPVDELAAALSIKSANSLADNYWLRAMGLNDRTNNTSYHDNRLWPSPLIVPVRMGDHDRRQAFRLRPGPALDPRRDPRARWAGVSADWDEESLDRSVAAGNVRRFPDQDEL